MMRGPLTFAALGALAWLVTAAPSGAIAQSSDKEAIDVLRNTRVSLLDIGLRELRRYVEDTLTRNHPPGLSPIRPTAYMLAGTDDIWIDVDYLPERMGTPSPDCKAALTATARLLIQPADSLPLTDFQQPGMFRIAEMFSSPIAGSSGAAATESSDAMMRHIRFHIAILDVSRKAEQSHCNARLLDL